MTRTLQIGQCWESWATRRRLRIDGFVTDKDPDTGDTLVYCSEVVGLAGHQIGQSTYPASEILTEYLYVGELGG